MHLSLALAIVSLAVDDGDSLYICPNILTYTRWRSITAFIIETHIWRDTYSIDEMCSMMECLVWNLAHLRKMSCFFQVCVCVYVCVSGGERERETWHE